MSRGKKGHTGESLAVALAALGKELERGSGLRLLLALEVHAFRREEAAGIGGHIEGLMRQALGRDLEDP